MSLLFALFLLVHGGIHVGYLCSRSWPFEPGDPWLVTGLGAPSSVVISIGVVAVLVAFLGFLIAALTAVGLLPPRLWRPVIAGSSVASAVALALFITPATIPGLAIDALLLWAVLVRDWRPAPVLGRRTRAGRPVTS